MEYAPDKEIKEKHLLHTTLAVLHIAQQLSVPYLTQVASLAFQILQTVQDIKDNQGAFQELADDAASLMAGFHQSYETSQNKDYWPPQGLKAVLVDLQSTLRAIKEYAELMKRRNSLRRLIHKRIDPGKVKRYRERLALHVSKFEIHSHIRINEAVFQIISCQRAADQAALEERERKVTKILSKHTALGASYDSSARDDAPGYAPETRASLVARIMQWVTDPDSTSFLWMYGSAESGKTSICQTIAHICDGEGLLSASFFFSRSLDDCPKDKTKFVSTIASQMWTSIPRIREHIAIAIDRDPLIFSKNLFKQMDYLVVEPFNTMSTQESTYDCQYPLDQQYSPENDDEFSENDEDEEGDEEGDEEHSDYNQEDLGYDRGYFDKDQEDQEGPEDLPEYFDEYQGGWEYGRKRTQEYQEHSGYQEYSDDNQASSETDGEYFDDTEEVSYDDDQDTDYDNDEESSDNLAVGPRLVIVDGLDECKGANSQIDILQVLTAAAMQLPSKILFLVASRPEENIRDSFNNKYMGPLTTILSLDDEDAGSDRERDCGQEENFY